MKSKNPLVIPRNHLVEKAINEAVEKCDFSMVNDLVEVLKNHLNLLKVNLVEPPKPGEDIKYLLWYLELLKSRKIIFFRIHQKLHSLPLSRVE